MPTGVGLAATESTWTDPSVTVIPMLAPPDLAGVWADSLGQTVGCCRSSIGPGGPDRSASAWSPSRPKGPCKTSCWFRWRRPSRSGPIRRSRGNMPAPGHHNRRLHVRPVPPCAAAARRRPVALLDRLRPGARHLPLVGRNLADLRRADASAGWRGSDPAAAGPHRRDRAHWARAGADDMRARTRRAGSPGRSTPRPVPWSAGLWMPTAGPAPSSPAPNPDPPGRPTHPSGNARRDGLE